MNNTFVIFKKEAGSYFNSAVAYFNIIAFLSVSAWLFFWLGFFFERGQAEMTYFFSLMPWLFLFFIPAMTMRLWAEEKKMGTVEMLMTLPIRSYEVVLGKFLACFLILVLMVVLSFPLPLSLGYLGNPDNGQIFTGYLGLILVGAAYIAIGLCASTFTSDQVIAFVVGIIVSFTMLVIGFVPQLRDFGLAYHFNSITRGVVDSRDLIYYFSVIGFFLYLSVLSVESKRWR